MIHWVNHTAQIGKIETIGPYTRAVRSLLRQAKTLGTYCNLLTPSHKTSTGSSFFSLMWPEALFYRLAHSTIALLTSPRRNLSVLDQSTELRGVFCPAITPFDEQLKPDIPLFVEHCQRLLKEGCHGLAMFGTTGEANSLSVEERMILLDALVESGIDASIIVPGTGCTALTDSVQLTRHAVQLGCRGVLMLPPFYYKNVSAEGLFRAFSEVIEQVAYDALKIYLYHIPPVSGVPLDLSLVKRLAEAYPNFVVGLKDSSGEWSYTEILLRSHPKFQVF